MTSYAFSKEIGVTPRTVINRIMYLWDELPKDLEGEKLEELRESFRLQPVRPNTGKPRPITELRYKKAMEILERDGFITSTALLKLFRTSQVEPILRLFEKDGPGLYDEEVERPSKYRTNRQHKTHKVYKLLQPLYDQWDEERKIVNGQGYNYSTNNNMRRIC